MIIFAVFYRGKFIARFDTRYEATRFIMNCRLCLSYDDVETSNFDIKEEYV